MAPAFGKLKPLAPASVFGLCFEDAKQHSRMFVISNHHELTASVPAEDLSAIQAPGLTRPWCGLRALLQHGSLALSIVIAHAMVLGC